MKQQYVLGFMFDETMATVLLMLKQRPTIQRFLFNGLGGSINQGETTFEAMAREFQEECGIVTEQADWQHFATFSGNDYAVHCFRTASEKIGSARKCEHEEIRIFSVRQLPNNCMPNLRWLIEMALMPSPITPYQINQ